MPQIGFTHQAGLDAALPEPVILKQPQTQETLPLSALPKCDLGEGDILGGPAVSRCLRIWPPTGPVQFPPAVSVQVLPIVVHSVLPNVC